MLSRFAPMETISSIVDRRIELDFGRWGPLFSPESTPSPTTMMLRSRQARGGHSPTSFNVIEQNGLKGFKTRKTYVRARGR